MGVIVASRHWTLLPGSLPIVGSACVRETRGVELGPPHAAAPLEAVMAWPEQIGMQSWRVHYRAGDGRTVSISGFTRKRAADVLAARDVAEAGL